jgi:hypothetical protein
MPTSTPTGSRSPAPSRQPPVTSPTTRPFPPGDLIDLVDDVIYEITDPRNLLPAANRQNSFAREQKQPGRFPRLKTDYRKPLPPRTIITFWPVAPRSP